MKKIFVMMIVAMMACTAVFAQSAVEMAKAQRELNEINMKLLNAKPTKDAKKIAKQRAKEGWLVMGSGRSMENQITADQLLAIEVMADESGNPVRRFLQHSASAVAGTQNAAYATARAACQTEIAAMIETYVAGAMQQKIDNAQSSAITAITVDKFHQRAKSIIDACLRNTLPGLNIYRVLSNNSFEAMVTISFDKKQMAMNLKQQLQKELELEGDQELNDLVNGVLVNM